MTEEVWPVKDLTSFQRLDRLGSYLLRAEKYWVVTHVLKEYQLETSYRKQEMVKPVLSWVFYYLPALFPEDWVFDRYWLRLKGSREANLERLVRYYFSLSAEEFDHLFVPMAQQQKFDGSPLHFDSEPWEVGTNILKLLKRITMEV